jgi:hypothetical protein
MMNKALWFLTGLCAGCGLALWTAPAIPDLLAGRWTLWASHPGSDGPCIHAITPCPEPPACAPASTEIKTASPALSLRGEL